MKEKKSLIDRLEDKNRGQYDIVTAYGLGHSFGIYLTLKEPPVDVPRLIYFSVMTLAGAYLLFNYLRKKKN